MKKLNPAYVEAVKCAVNTSSYFSLISMEIKNLEPGHTRLEVLLEEKHHHPFVWYTVEFLRPLWMLPPIGLFTLSWMRGNG